MHSRLYGILFAFRLCACVCHFRKSAHIFVSHGEIDVVAAAYITYIPRPGPGTCSAMFTANSMSSAIEALGLSPPGTASHPAMTRENKLTKQKLLAAYLILGRGGERVEVGI